MTIITDGPIYRSKSITKNGKRYDLEKMSWVFDCPHDEYIRTFETKEAAETALDMHYFHHHPDEHVPLVPEDIKSRIDEIFESFRIRAFSPVGLIRDAAK